MPFALRDGVSYCRVAGRAVFLDLTQDRYLCLSPELERVFLRLAAGGPGQTGRGAALERLLRSELVVRHDGAADRLAPVAAPPPTGDLLTLSHKTRPCLVTAALAAELRMMWSLRRRGLARTVARIEASRHGPNARTADAAGLAHDLAAAFEASALVFGAFDRCLPRALAMADLGARHGLDVALLFGVRLNPFAAHSWVQWGNQVLVGGFEQARAYQPILAR